MNAVAISNESAMIYASSVVTSPSDSLLIAAHVVSSSQELLRAIKASLATNSKKFLHIRPTEGSTIHVQGARKGYTGVSANLANAHAEGYAAVWLHPLCGNPQDHTEDHFFVVSTTALGFHDLFTERLNLAIPWPVKPEWAAWLITQGADAKLIEPLYTDGPDFPACVRVLKDPARWAGIISHGLQTGNITI